MNTEVMETDGALSHAINTQTANLIRAIERRRCNAMIAGDLEILDIILDPALTFCHATGAIDDKQGYLDKLSAGRINYKTIEWSEEQFTSLGDCVIMIGRMRTDVEVAGTRKQLDNRVTTVWTRCWENSQQNQPWRLVTFQSTPIKT